MAGRVFRLLSLALKRRCLLQTKFLVHHSNVTRNVSSFQLIYNDYGDPREVISHRIVELKPLKENEVLVKMLMAPINPSDINMVEGTYFIRPSLPAIPGNEGVGEVVEVGSAVKTLQVGDWVNPADSGWGTWRNWAVSSPAELSKVSNDIPVMAAATLVVNPCTAYRMLKDFIQLQPGDVVIQNGANSSVGQAVIQLARQWNIRTVNIVRNRPELEKLAEALKKLGADHVITEEFARSGEMKIFMQSLNSKPKLALNCVGGKSATELLRNLDQKGVMVTYGGMSKQPILVPTGSLIFKEVEIKGYWNTEWNKCHRDSSKKQAMLDELCDLIRKGQFLLPDSYDYPLEMHKTAVELAMEGFKCKKVMFNINRDV